jgi:hypothetical protein
MTKAYVFNQTTKEVTDFLNEHGFQYKKSHGRIMKLIDDGFFGIIINIIDYRPVFQIEMYLGVRLDAIEEIVNRFLEWTFANPKFMKYTETISTSYKALSGAKDNYIEVESESQLQERIKELTLLIKEKGLVFFEKNRSLNNVNLHKKQIILNDTSGIAHILTNLMQSLTLMKLCNDPDFDVLSEKYKKLYVAWEGQEESGRKALDDLIEFLKGYNPEKRGQA